MTETTYQDRAKVLAELLDRQARLYDQLQRLSDTQSRLVADANAEPLLEVLSQRQQLIDQLVAVSEQVEPYKQDWAEIWGALDHAAREHLRGLIERVRGRLDEIIEQDELDRKALSEHRQAAGQEVQQMRHGAVVNRAYGRSMPAEPRYTDRQG